MVNRAQFTLIVNGRSYTNDRPPIHDCSTDVGVAREKYRFFTECVQPKEEERIMRSNLNCCNSRYQQVKNIQNLGVELMREMWRLSPS